MRLFRLIWIWDIYYMLYVFYVCGLIFSFVAPTSPINMYYRTLIAFDVLFLVPYYLNLLAVIASFLAIFPLYSYIQKTPTFSAQFCRWLFIWRLVLDLLGRSYERNLIQCATYQSPRLVLLMLGVTILWLLPSYWALFRCSFQEENKKRIQSGERKPITTGA